MLRHLSLIGQLTITLLGRSLLSTEQSMPTWPFLDPKKNKKEPLPPQGRPNAPGFMGQQAGQASYTLASTKTHTGRDQHF